MKTPLKPLVIAGLAGFAFVFPLAAQADDDYDLALDLFEHGEIHSLVDILKIVGKRSPGEVVAVDLVRKNNKWVYQIQVVGSDGRRATVDVDGGAGAIMPDGGGD